MPKNVVALAPIAPSVRLRLVCAKAYALLIVALAWSLQMFCFTTSTAAAVSPHTIAA